MEIFCLLKNMVFNLFYNREKKEFLMYKELDVYDFVKEFRNSRFKDNFSDMQYAFIYGIIILVPEVSILD